MCVCVRLMWMYDCVRELNLFFPSSPTTYFRHVNIREGFFNYRGYSQTGSISILAAQQKQFRATQRFGDDFPVNHSKSD